MRDIFAYAVPFLSLLFACASHWYWRVGLVRPSIISALGTGAVALCLYALAGKGTASYLALLAYSVATGFILALLIGFLVKYTSRWFR